MKNREKSLICTYLYREIAIYIYNWYRNKIEVNGTIQVDESWNDTCTTANKTKQFNQNKLLFWLNSYEWVDN